MRQMIDSDGCPFLCKGMTCHQPYFHVFVQDLVNQFFDVSVGINSLGYVSNVNVFHNCCCLLNSKSFCQTREEIHKQISSPKVNKTILDVVIPVDVLVTDINLEFRFYVKNH